MSIFADSYDPLDTAGTKRKTQEKRTLAHRHRQRATTINKKAREPILSPAHGHTDTQKTDTFFE